MTRNIKDKNNFHTFSKAIGITALIWNQTKYDGWPQPDGEYNQTMSWVNMVTIFVKRNLYYDGIPSEFQVKTICSCSSYKNPDEPFCAADDLCNPNRYP